MQKRLGVAERGGGALRGPPVAAVRYSPQDLLAMLWRERGLMLAVFLAVSALGLRWPRSA